MSFKKIFNLLLIVFFIAFGVFVCINKINNTSLINDTNKNLQVYELWHIESFEGGGKNRQNYLNQLALEYEKYNPGILFMIKSINPEQLENALKQNTPHLLSFSEQVAKIVLPHLTEFDMEFDIQDHYLESATYNGNLLAIPFIASGYCYFTKTNSKDNLCIYTGNDSSHNATHLIESKNINNEQKLSSYQCYSKFVNSNNIKLLGTARDLFRIKQLENLGRFTINYQPISTFTDLVQYIGKSCNDKHVLKFINFIMNDLNQQKLVDLSLFSTKHLKLYSEPIYSAMETALTTCFVPNIFNY